MESVTVKLLKKGNYQVIYPENVDSLCCGLSLASKGLASPAELLSTKVLDELYRISEAGKIPIICDSSPCVHHIRETIQTSDKYRALQFAVFEPVEFICCFVENHLEWAQVFESILLHVPCSIKKLKMQNDIERLAQKCAKEVINSGVSCCGMAGDRGLRYPELGTSACEPLHRALVGKNPVIGFSTSTTCEIQMANQSKINFSSILHLFNAATSTK